MGTVPDILSDGLAGAGAAAPVLDVAPTGPLTFGVTPVVIAPGGALVIGVGALWSAFGAGGDCIDPDWAKAGAAATIKAKAKA